MEDSEEDSGSQATKESLARTNGSGMNGVGPGLGDVLGRGEQDQSQISCTSIRRSLCTVNRVRGYKHK